MFKDQKKDRLDSYRDKSETQQEQPAIRWYFFLFSLEGWSAKYCTSPKKKEKHLMMIAGYNKRVKDIQLI